jgi:uncharacterized Fe-S center protein
MITNFEELTCELNAVEIGLLDALTDILNNYTKQQPAKSEKIVSDMKMHIANHSLNVSFSGVRLRKMINHLRRAGTLPIIGTSKGYYVSYNHDEVCKQIQSLVERANSIEHCAKGLLKFT